MQAAKEESR